MDVTVTSNQSPLYEVIPCKPDHTHDSTHQPAVYEIPEIPKLPQEEGNGSTPHTP